MARKLNDTQKQYVAAIKEAATEEEKEAAANELMENASLPVGTIRNLLESGHITQDMADMLIAHSAAYAEAQTAAQEPMPEPAAATPANSPISPLGGTLPANPSPAPLPGGPVQSPSPMSDPLPYTLDQEGAEINAALRRVIQRGDVWDGKQDQLTTQQLSNIAAVPGLQTGVTNAANTANAAETAANAATAAAATATSTANAAVKTVNGNAPDASGNVNTTGTGGTSVHNELTGRDAANQHPISAIAGLETALSEPERDFTALPIQEGELSQNAVTDSKIGFRAVLDQVADGNLVPINNKYLTTWLQALRNNMKHAFTELERLDDIDDEIEKREVLTLTVNAAQTEIVVTFSDNTQEHIDISKAEIDIDFDPNTKELIFTDPQGNEERVPLGDLVPVIEGDDGDHINIDVTNNVVSAQLKAGTVTKTELHADLVDFIEEQAFDDSDVNDTITSLEAELARVEGEIPDNTDFVDLTTAQTIAGEKTFNADVQFADNKNIHMQAGTVDGVYLLKADTAAINNISDSENGDLAIRMPVYMTNNPIHDLADPVGPQDGVNKRTHDKKQDIPTALANSVISGFSSFLAFVRGTPAGVYHVSDDGASPTNTWTDRPRDNWRGERSIVVIDKVLVGTEIEGIVTVTPTTGSQPSVFRGWYEVGWTRAWTEIGGTGGGNADGNAFMVVPDYGNMEPTNLITASPWSYTADRMGFVKVDAYVTVTGPAQTIVAINGVDFHVRGGTTEAGTLNTRTGVARIFAVAPGDVVQWRSGNNFQCHFIPPKYIWATTPAAEFHAKLIGQPDYANIETVNRITQQGGSWTADRDGYVFWQVYSSTQPGTIRIDIGSRTVQRVSVAITGLPHSSVLPITKGQTVSITVANGATWSGGDSSGCWFIPPISVAPMFVTGVDIVSSTERGKINIDPVTKEATINGWEGTGGNPKTVTMHSTDETHGDSTFNFSRNNIPDLPPDGGILDDIIISADNFKYLITNVGSYLDGELLREVGEPIMPMLPQFHELERWTFWAASLTYVGWRRKDGGDLRESANYQILGNYYGQAFDIILEDGHGELPNGESVYIVNRNGKIHLEGGDENNYDGIEIFSAADPGAVAPMKPNTDVMATYWHSSRLQIRLNDALYSMTGQERFELTFIEVMNSANIEMYSHIALTEKLFEPIDELFGTNPGEMFSLLEGPIRRIEDYCQQYGEFDMENPYDWDVYNDVDELLNGLNMIDMIDPKLMSLKMDFKYLTENGRELTLMPMGISGSKGANEVIVPYIRNKESVQ